MQSVGNSHSTSTAESTMEHGLLVKQYSYNSNLHFLAQRDVLYLLLIGLAESTKYLLISTEDKVVVDLRSTDTDTAKDIDTTRTQDTVNSK